MKTSNTHIVIKEEQNSQFTFEERVLREYVSATVESVVSEIRCYLSEKYDKMIYSEKIKYTNSKEYRKRQRISEKDSDESVFEQLGYWTSHNRDGASNVPHISSNSYCGRIFNGIVEGYTPSITEDEYLKIEVKRIMSEIDDNDIVQMVKMCFVDCNNWKANSNFNEFCINHQKGCSNVIIKQLEQLDSILDIPNTNRRSVYMKNGFYLYEDKIQPSPYRNITHREKESVEDCCEMDVQILETKKKTHINVYTRLYPLQKQIIGLKKGDTFNLPNVENTYLIEKIY